nr:uncharacterized protein LOC107395668 [Nothobranchius furzeri]XP_054607797.1 uncharacterized protein LOC107395668 [Nothobranchius furzeri]
MEFTALHLLWLLSATSLTKQDSVRLKVSPIIAAQCDTRVFLYCNASSSQPGLSIKYMDWSQDVQLCSVNEKGDLSTNNVSTDFHCKYQEGQLTLVLHRALPLKSGNSSRYVCKLRSNQGTLHEYTTVQLQECCGRVESSLSSRGPNCTFSNVYPDGDVHWFQGSQNLSDGSVSQSTAKSVDNGWLTIYSWLTISGQETRSDVPYNCSLKSPMSDKYIASSLVPKLIPIKGKSQEQSTPNRAASQKTRTTVLFVLVSSLFAWK